MGRSRYQPGDGSIDRARDARQNPTPAEDQLWQALRGNKLGGHKFRRQQRLGPYRGDLVCQDAKLVVEVDGDTHADAASYDARRTAFLQREGYRVIRFSNADVMDNLDGVAATILASLGPSPSHASHGPSAGWSAPRADQSMPGAWTTRHSLPRGERRK